MLCVAYGIGVLAGWIYGRRCFLPRSSPAAMQRSLKGCCALLAGADTPTAKFFINCLAEPAEEVAQYLVPRIRKVPQEARSLGGSMSQVRGPRSECFMGSVRLGTLDQCRLRCLLRL